VHQLRPALRADMFGNGGRHDIPILPGGVVSRSP
jgi:hypothetical protein